MMKWEEMQQDIYPVPFRIKRRSDIYFFKKKQFVVGLMSWVLSSEDTSL